MAGIDTWRRLAFGYDPQNAPDAEEEPMALPKLYEIVWTEQTICTAYVRADSVSEAATRWREDDLVSQVTRVDDGSHLHQVNEMPSFHDRLCCCPTCEGAL